MLLRAAFFSRPLEELHWVALLVVSGSVLCALCTVLLKMCVCVWFLMYFFVGVLASMGFFVLSSSSCTHAFANLWRGQNP